jgi:predicted metal-dependent HD superfamily phosphohydrolase
LFGQIASQSFQEGLMVYRAAWRRGLTTPEIDKLASASAIGERYDHGYWLKEKIFRQIRSRVRNTALEKELTRLYYTGQFAEYSRRISEVPAN